jgi:hypothetical protein
MINLDFLKRNDFMKYFVKDKFEKFQLLPRRYNNLKLLIYFIQCESQICLYMFQKITHVPNYFWNFTN